MYIHTHVHTYAQCVCMAPRGPRRSVENYELYVTHTHPCIHTHTHTHVHIHTHSVSVWRREVKGWVRSVENYELYVTHNGDLDYYPLFGIQRTQRELGAWLAKVLDYKGTVVGCDSVKVCVY
jgi:hypothetical protein